MAYQHANLAKAILDRISVGHFQLLDTIAKDLAIDRHTATAALASLGLDFKLERRRSVLRAADALLAGNYLSVKEIAGELEFKSAGAFSRFYYRSTGRWPSSARKACAPSWGGG